jgi:omega-6 fatty acid desaturase (delta-12 desaturase)
MNQSRQIVTACAMTRAGVPVLTGYREPSLARSMLELLITAVPFAILWMLMWAALDAGYWPCLVLGLPAAGFLVRLYDPARLRPWIVLSPSSGE